MTVAMITETDANPGESGYLAGQLSAEGIKVLRAAGPEISSHGPVRILMPFVATQVTARACRSRCHRCRRLDLKIPHESGDSR